jgi:methylase of polypeptide subunit release factors
MAFGPLTVTFDDDVLEPRPWTLLQATWAAELAAAEEGHGAAGPLLELCSGAGHIGQAAVALSGRPIVQVDVDPHACRLARANAEANGLADRVEVRCGDLEADGLLGDERYRLILADPPYVPSDEAAALEDDPPGAVDGGSDGLDLGRRCLTVAARHLAPGGAVLLQALGAAQVEALGPDIADAGLAVVEVRTEDERRAVALLRPAEPVNP